MKKRVTQKVHLLCIIFLIFFFTFFLLPLIPTASAGGQDATFDSIAVKAIPPVQGVGGEVRIEATAKFYGGCCYILYAHDVKPELSAPQNISIVSSLPKTIGQVDAVAGGSPTTEKFKWTIVSNSPGTYNITIKIGTSNCGSFTKNVQVMIIQAASISNPTIFPSKPSVSEKITFSADALSGSTYVDVEKTTLYIWGSTKDYSMERLRAEKDKLFEIKGDFELNETVNNQSDIATKYLGLGKIHQMSLVQFTNTWRVQVDDIKKEENIYYWFTVETSDGKTITSFVYKQTIEDLEKKYQMLNYMVWGTFIVIAFGITLILGISWAYLNRPAKKLGKTSIFVLGSSYSSKPSDAKRANVTTFSLERFRTLLFWSLIIILIISLIISIQQGLFQDLITETGG